MTRTPALIAAAVGTVVSLLVGGAAIVATPAQATATQATATQATAAPTVPTTVTPALTPRADPRRTQGLFVDPLMPAAQHGKRYARIGRQAQALWLTDYYPTGQVKAAARAYVSRAEKAGKTPVLAIYAIPDRDCGGYSAGGLADAAAYSQWVGQAAAGITGSHALVVLEPDALPFVGQCSDEGDREQMLAKATRRFAKAGAWVYIDAGHDGWQSATEMAQRLKDADVADARGFSLNVANYRPTGVEQSYATQILAALKQLGVTGKHYVVDTSRNGGSAAKHAVVGEVCNQTWARIGATPKLLLQGAYDGRLWVKHPGESDGTCNGGPASGQWCDLLADRLLGRRTDGEGC
jgi:endoglucanase